MIMRMITTGIEADVANTETFENFISAENLDRHYDGDSKSKINRIIRSRLTGSDRMKLLRGIVARSDLT